jgi:hypothetical protein
MRRALLVLALLLLAVAGLVVADAALSTRIDGELEHLEVTDAAMAGRHHPPGSACVRYAAAAPEPTLAELRETGAALRALDLPVDAWGDLFGHLFTLELRREQALHGRSMAEEYLEALERTTASRPLARLAVALQRQRLLGKLDVLTATRDMAATGEAAFAKLGARQQEGVLSLLAAKPTHFRLAPFVRLLEDARDQEEQARLGPPPPGEALPGEDAAGDPCPPLPRHATITRAELNAALSGDRDVVTQARVVPAFVNGAFQGFKLFVLRRSTRLSEVGFCNGDRVLSINGHALSSPEAVLDGTTEWRRASSLEFRLVRAGVAGTLTLDVEPAR